MSVDVVSLSDVTLSYAARGQGEPVLFVHGAVTDWRMWERHLDHMAPHHRAVAYSQRYHGAGDWDPAWPPFGVGTHATDLEAVIDALDLGPVHCVAWSYGGNVALTAALRSPHLMRSLFVYEPGSTTWVHDPAALGAFGADAQEMFGPVVGAVQSGDFEGALRTMLDGSGRRPGSFDAQPAALQRIQLDNARALPLVIGQAPPPPVTAADLAGLMVPTCIAWGEHTRPLFAIPSQAAAQAIPGDHHHAVPGQGHLFPDQDPAAFCAEVRRFIASV